MGMLQPFQDCGAIIREIAGRVKRILDMPAMFVWYFKEENTLRFWRLCGRIEKNTPKENCRDPSTTLLCHGCCRHRYHQPCSAAVLYFSAQPDQCYPGAGTGSGAGAFQDGKLCGEPDAAGRTRTNECKIDASPCLRSKEMSKEKGSAGEDEAPPQGRLVPSPQHKAACFLPWLPDKTKYDTRKGSFDRTFVPLYRCAQNA